MWTTIKEWGAQSEPQMWTVIGGIVLCAIIAVVIMVGGVVYVIAG